LARVGATQANFVLVIPDSAQLALSVINENTHKACCIHLTTIAAGVVTVRQTLAAVFYAYSGRLAGSGVTEADFVTVIPHGVLATATAINENPHEAGGVIATSLTAVVIAIWNPTTAANTAVLSGR